MILDWSVDVPKFRRWLPDYHSFLNGVLMKRFWLHSLIVVLGAYCCSASATEASLILVNGKVWTENPAQPTAQAVALDGSRILAVGDNTAIRKLTGPMTRVIDLGGRLLLPGFNDSHVHFLMGGGSLISVHLAPPTARPSSRSASPNSLERFPKARGCATAFGITHAGIRHFSPPTN
jgi:Amidohydrolase family